MFGYKMFFDNIVKRTKFKKSPKNLTSTYIQKNDLTNNSIIYSDNNIDIIYNNIILETICKLVAIPDSNDSSRYFIIIMIQNHNIYNITGLFVYFNNMGDVIDKILLDRILWSVDSIITVNNAFLYNQSLIFFVKYQNKMLFSINCFNYYDLYQGNYIGYLIDSIIENCSIYINRYLIFTSNIHHIIDMGTIHPDNILDSYFTLPIANRVLDTIILIDNNKSLVRKYNDSYPIDCIKCNNPTTVTIFNSSISENVSISIQMGRSYCYQCKIRFSLSKNNWICCLMKDNSNIEFCSNPSIHCDKEHNNVSFLHNVTFVEKKPYKNDGILQIKI